MTQSLSPKDSAPTASALVDNSLIPPGKADMTALIIGNLNTGKTTLFNQVCKKNLKVANYPGTAIAIGRGTFTEAGTKFHLIDTPGINSVIPESEDDKISRDILLDEKPDIIALVADGKNLRKSLLLILQVAEYEIPMLLDINMMDEVRQRGIQINAQKLSSLLGIPVTETVAMESQGLGSFQKAFAQARQSTKLISYPEKVESAISLISDLLKDSGLPTRAVALALLSSDEELKSYVIAKCGRAAIEPIESITSNVQSSFNRSLATIILEARLQDVDRVVSDIQTISPPARMPFADKIGEWSRRPLTGVPIAALVVMFMYFFIGVFGEVLIGIFEGQLFGDWIVPATEKLLSKIPYQFVIDAFVGEFGLVSVGLSLAFGMLIPVLSLFFLSFGALEESGYLPRLSILLDRILRKIGLNGKGLLPLVLGFSCITMAILTTRMLETKRERYITTMLLVLGLPCAPLLAVMLILLAKLSMWASVVVFGVIFSQIIIIGFILGKILPGQRSDFIMELPPMRIPKLWNLLKKTYWRVWWFTREAVPLFLLATFVLFILDQIGMLDFLKIAGKPVMTGLLGLPPESVQVVIATLIRRESGAAMLNELSDKGVFGGVETVVCLLVLTFLSPCVNAVLVMLKEQGLKGTLSIMAFVTSWAIVVGSSVNWVCRALNVSF
ncbi:ferrous iron transport protein B [Planctomycetota bacterium]